MELGVREEEGGEAAEVGGYDVLWQPELDALPSVDRLNFLAEEVVEVLEGKGWCLIQLPQDEDLRYEAVHQALSLPDLACPKAELAEDYLGRGGSGKTGVLEPAVASGESLTRDGEPWALREYDRQLTLLSKALAPHTGGAMGFRCAGRRKGLVWMPFSDSLEEGEMQPEPLSEVDIQAGVLEAHLHFIRSRRLCLMAWIDNEGGDFLLYPRPDRFPDAEPVRLLLAHSQLIVFRCDLMAYSCEPATRNALSLTTWILDDELDVQRLTGGYLVGEEADKSEALGILIGPPMPVGYRTHVMAMHAHAPCDTHDIEEFSMIFTGGCDGYAHIPQARFDTDIYCSEGQERVPYKSYVVHAAMLETDELMMFDNAFFGISDEEARFVSPGQRVVLQDGYLTLHRAGFTKESLRGRNMGAYCGDTGSEFSVMSQLSPAFDASPDMAANDKPFGKVVASSYMQPGVMSIVTAGRLSHALGMIGGASSVDTACSASLVGVSVAVQSFRKPSGQQLGACADKHNEDALCVGISCLLSPLSFIGLCGPSMLSEKGRCFTFDVGASGYARGDGFSGVYLKPSSSEEDRMAQVACLMGCAVNQDGRSATLTAPNGTAQQACIRDSMREAGLVANQITIGECHGTGTALGDPIEVGAYRGVMEPREVPLLSTSAKSNIGHLECCAGLTGLLKCCLMVSRSCASANVHLHTVNPHLDVDGFPVFFETEAVDTGLNSNYAGVSSFGFSGTNARADVWSLCRSGPRRAARRDPEGLPVYVRCPVTLGLMDLLTGENVSGLEVRTQKAGVLRDEWAPYDISRQAYEGGFRYRSDAAEDGGYEEELDPFDAVFISGSWSAYTSVEAMERTSNGWHVARVVLGECRFETFRLCLNESPALELYPTVAYASERIWIEGPDEKANGRCWCIDGRDKEVPAGTVYEVRFKWHPERKSIHWTPCAQPASAMAVQPSYQHTYALVGTFAADVNCEMVPDGRGRWEGSFRIGPSGSEEFRILRDRDPDQTIYPARPRTVRSGVPVRGPDGLGGDKGWLVHGPPGDAVRVRVHIVDAHVTVTASSDARGTKVWESEEGMARHQYCVAGSWTDGAPVHMVADPAEGVYRAFGRVRGNADNRGPAGEFEEAFQILVDEDFGQALYPQSDGAGSGECLVMGPDGDGRGRRWVIRAPVPSARFEICFSPSAVDRRKLVTWSWMQQQHR